MFHRLTLATLLLVGFAASLSMEWRPALRGRLTLLTNPLFRKPLVGFDARIELKRNIVT